MRIGIINVVNLTRVRETFQPGWQIFIAATLLLAVFYWWASVRRLKRLSPLVDDETLRTRTLILAAVVRDDTLAVVTARRNSETLYESALDVAAILAVGDPAQSVGMIPKYLA